MEPPPLSPSPPPLPGLRPILFSSQHFRRSGRFTQNERHPNKEILTAEGGARLYRVHTDGTMLTPMTSGREDCRSCCWSPEGSYIALDAASCEGKDDDLTDGYHSGPRHVYIMGADGSQRYRLSTRKTANSAPLWSPDGRFLLFRQAEDDSESSAFTYCLVPVPLYQRSVSPIPLIPPVDGWKDGPGTASWSPDGRWIAIQVGPGYGSQPRPRLYLIDLKDTCNAIHKAPHLLELPGILQFTWSPDGKWIYLYRSNGTGQLLELTTGKTKTAAAVLNALWLHSGKILGEPADTSYDSAGLQILTATGARERLLAISQGKSLNRPQHGPTSDDTSSDMYPVFHTQRRWHPLPYHPGLYLVATQEHISDGLHFKCHLVDIRRGAARYHYLRSGRFLGFSPEGRQFLVADYQWVGPYKRGGRRVGPLEVVGTLDGRHLRFLTGNLSSVGSADWFA